MSDRPQSLGERLHAGERGAQAAPRRAHESAPWQGRHLHFIGIGGAGMSGLARVALELGARVSGSDRADSPYLALVRRAGAEVALGHDPRNVPPDAEVVVSTAIASDNVELVRARERGQRILHRADLLAELTRLRRTIAVSGTHGKTTTAAMIVHILERAGRAPSFVVGAKLRGYGTNARLGGGDWLVVEADESDRSFLKLAREIAVVTNVELDHHTTYASIEELESAFAQFIGPARIVVVGPEVPLPTAFAGQVKRAAADDRAATADPPLRLPLPGRHNVINARLAIAAAEAVGVARADAVRALDDFAGTERRLEAIGRSPTGAQVYDDYAHHPTEVAATLAAARELRPAGRLVAVFQPHLYSRTRALGREFGRSLAHADMVVVTDVFAARENPSEWPGVSGLAVVRGVAEAAPGRPLVWAPTLRSALAALRRSTGAGDLVVTMGAGDIDRVARAFAHGSPLVDEPPGIERGVPLARFTTVRTGGPAEFFARADDLERLCELLAWAVCQGLPVEAIGSGSNLLVADQGVRGLVVKLEGHLSAIEIEGERVLCGGGARLPQVAARAARAGLAGLEFAVNIPGTVGGAVRMNANAYGGELGAVLEWVEVATPAGVRRLRPAELGFGYRRSALRPGEVVARAAFRLRRSTPEQVRAELERLRRARREAQPSGIKTFGSTFKNPPPDDPRAQGRTAGMLLDAAGCRGLRIGGARFSEKHANFVENLGDATTADIVRLMGEGRRRVRERFGVELEPEVRFLGEVDLAPLF